MVDLGILDIDMVFRVFLLAIVQGIAEFLPISSSGHLLVLGRLFELPDVFLLSILLHLGTLLSVLVFFGRELGFVIAHRPRVIGLVIVGSIPTVLIAFSVMKFFPWLETSRLTTGVCFLVTAFLLLTVMRRYSRTEEEEYLEKVAYQDEGFEPPEMKTAENTTLWDAFCIGVAQGFAVLPGLSRSGSTISTGVLLRLKNQWSAEFSFYLSIPVIAGGAFLEIYKEFKQVGFENWRELVQMDSTFLLYVGGALVSFLVGWVSLFYLMQMLKAGKLHRFATWLIFVGVAVLAWTAIDHSAEISKFLNKNAAEPAAVETVEAEVGDETGVAEEQNADEQNAEEAVPADDANEAAEPANFIDDLGDTAKGAANVVMGAAADAVDSVLELAPEVDEAQ